MREVQFAFLDSGFEGGLFSFVEHSVMIGVVASDLGIHLADVFGHHLGVWFVSVRGVGRQLDGTITDSFGERFFFFVVQLTILVQVERGDFREELCEMRRNGSGIIMTLGVMAGCVSVMNLPDGQAA